MTEKDIQGELIGTWINRNNELDKAVSIGMYGPPEIKHSEKILYLGELKERVIKLLSKRQVAEPAIYPEIIEALKDNRAARLVINGQIPDSLIKKYEQLARKLGKHYTVVHNPELKGETGLIVAGNNAVNVENISVPGREIRLHKLGLSDTLINAAGKKVCPHCYEKIIHADPGEAINYKKLTWSDRFWGEHCHACAKYFLH